MKSITIGIPVYNEEDYIERAVRVASAQADCVVVSDNTSTDGTGNICATLLNTLKNVEYVRHLSNKGANANFGYLLDSADTPYFMWLGAHDWLSSEYVCSVLDVLETDPGAVLAFTASDHVNTQSGIRLRRNDYEVLRDALASHRTEIRALAIARYLEDCTIYHGLWRTDVLRDCWTKEKFLGNDHLVLLNAALSGRILMSPTGTYFRGHSRIKDSKLDQLRRITGDSSAVHVDWRPLAMGSYRAVRTRIRSPFWLVRIRVALISRFGPVAERGAISMISDLIIMVLSRCYKFSHKVVRKVTRLIRI